MGGWFDVQEDVKREQMTLKEALIKYNHIDWLNVYFCKKTDNRLIERLCWEKNIDELALIKRILVKLNENTMSDVTITTITYLKAFTTPISVEITVDIRVNYDDTPPNKKNFRDRYQKKIMKKNVVIGEYDCRI